MSAESINLSKYLTTNILKVNAERRYTGVRMASDLRQWAHWQDRQNLSWRVYGKVRFYFYLAWKYLIYLGWRNSAYGRADSTIYQCPWCQKTCSSCYWPTACGEFNICIHGLWHLGEDMAYAYRRDNVSACILLGRVVQRPPVFWFSSCVHSSNIWLIVPIQ